MTLAHSPINSFLCRTAMFRRPLLGAAVVYGASRSGARRGVEEQEQRNAEAQLSAEMAAEKQRREEEQRERRTQLAIDEAIAKERSKNTAIEAEPRYFIPNTGGTGIPDDVPPYSKFNRGPGDAVIKRAATHYCPECRNVCQLGDKFCTKCGCRQPVDEERTVLPENQS
ncbi:hypothetical protein V502_01449 [Pseudogymnoascus sp. VKM F-4520 (FW-2644)]|nr:hypothetical protein V502_01449 [Pseudogymnoascus sp. VKM F-4520 (FW-2644)]